jgi:hypothetical protein
MESDPISTIEYWTTPTLVREGQMLLGFTNIY